MTPESLIIVILLCNLLHYKAIIVGITCVLYCSFEYRLRVALSPGGDLMLTSRIRNTNADGKSFSFTFAYHTYFKISDIRYVFLTLMASTFEIFNPSA
jgi:D-hexose-6-phosphate mutarotase